MKYGHNGREQLYPERRRRKIMKITKISTDPNGDSVLSEIEIDLKDAGDIGLLSKRYPVKEIIFRETLWKRMHLL